MRDLEASSVTKSAFKVMVGGVLSLSFGLMNQVVIAAFYGATSGMDAYLTALVIPAYFHLVLVSGLSFVFIPAFVREETSGKEQDAWALVGTFFWIMTIVVFIIAVTGALFSTQIIALSAPGFDQKKSALAARMLTVLMFTIPFTGLGSFTIGIQNARNRFFWPSFGGAANSIANVVVLLILYRILGPMALCWAYLASTVTQAGISVIPVIAHGWKKLLPLSDTRVQQMGRLMVPLILSGLLTCFPSVAERYFASGFPNGQISYIGYAYKISNIFISLLAIGIASAIFPSMARSYVQNGLPGLAEKHNYGLRLSFAVALPAIMITSAMAIPAISTIFQRGAFRPMDTLGVSRILFAVLLSDVLFRMIGNIFTRSYYVLKDTLTPAIIGSIATILYIASGQYFANHWGYSGLVWARTIQNGLFVFALWFLVTRKLQDIQGMKTSLRILEYFLAASAAYLFCRFILSRLALVPDIFQLTIGVSVGISLYLLILYLRDREMLEAILEIVGVKSIYMKFLDDRARSQEKIVY
jgi:putative peptidoglycan lipid II flippase